MNLRAFIAIELPEPVRQEIVTLQTEFKRSAADVKWVDLANLHLTLKFLGNTPEEKIPLLTEALRAAAADTKPFALQLEGIGTFPRTTSPKVLWVGVHHGTESLLKLAEAVEKTCVDLGFAAEDRPFSPHLTIGRVLSRNHLAPLIKQLQLAIFCGKTRAEISHLTLFRSILSPKGSIYTPLAELPLGFS